MIFRHCNGGNQIRIPANQHHPIAQVVLGIMQYPKRDVDIRALFFKRSEILRLRKWAGRAKPLNSLCLELAEDYVNKGQSLQSRKIRDLAGGTRSNDLGGKVPNLRDCSKDMGFFLSVTGVVE
ncbi:MAG: hypothetical protein NTW96_00645 [Planctomycetia bacterium]|nr:hypothetical protein [Planctomycetia bacterium]